MSACGSVKQQQHTVTYKITYVERIQEVCTVQLRNY